MFAGHVLCFITPITKCDKDIHIETTNKLKYNEFVYSPKYFFLGSQIVLTLVNSSVLDKQ